MFSVRAACMHGSSVSSPKISSIVFGLKTATLIGRTAFALEGALAHFSAFARLRIFIFLHILTDQTAQSEVQTENNLPRFRQTQHS